MNSFKKNQSRENEIMELAKKKLITEGYIYWIPPRTWGDRDIMGVYDFIAMKGSRTIFVQMTTIQHLSDRRKKIHSFNDLNNVRPPNVFIWAYDPKKADFKIQRVK